MKCRKTIYLVLVFLLSVFAVGCEENEPMEFEGGSRALFYEEGSSLVGIVMQIYEKNYSFALVTYDQMEIEAKINVRLMGTVVDRDRKFKAEVVKELSTAVEGTHFRLGEGVMKAGEYWSQLPITLYRTADMKEKAVSITLRLVATEDLLGRVIRESFTRLRKKTIFIPYPHLQHVVIYLSVLFRKTGNGKIIETLAP